MYSLVLDEVSNVVAVPRLNSVYAVQFGLKLGLHPLSLHVATFCSDPIGCPSVLRVVWTQHFTYFSSM